MYPKRVVFFNTINCSLEYFKVYYYPRMDNLSCTGLFIIIICVQTFIISLCLIQDIFKKTCRIYLVCMSQSMSSDRGGSRVVCIAYIGAFSHQRSCYISFVYTSINVFTSFIDNIIIRNSK